MHCDRDIACAHLLADLPLLYISAFFRMSQFSSKDMVDNPFVLASCQPCISLHCALIVFIAFNVFQHSTITRFGSLIQS